MPAETAQTVCDVDAEALLGALRCADPENPFLEDVQAAHDALARIGGIDAVPGDARPMVEAFLWRHPVRPDSAGALREQIVDRLLFLAFGEAQD